MPEILKKDIQRQLMAVKELEERQQEISNTIEYYRLRSVGFQRWPFDPSEEGKFTGNQGYAFLTSQALLPVRIKLQSTATVHVGADYMAILPIGSRGGENKIKTRGGVCCNNQKERTSENFVHECGGGNSESIWGCLGILLRRKKVLEEQLKNLQTSIKMSNLALNAEGGSLVDEVQGYGLSRMTGEVLADQNKHGNVGSTVKLTSEGYFDIREEYLSSDEENSAHQNTTSTEKETYSSSETEYRRNHDSFMSIDPPKLETQCEMTLTVKERELLPSEHICVDSPKPTIEEKLKKALDDPSRCDEVNTNELTSINMGCTDTTFRGAQVSRFKQEKIQQKLNQKHQQ